MSILSVDQIQPIGSGTTITLNATEVKTGTEITVGTGASIFSPAGNTLTFGTNNVERIRIKNDGKVGINTSNTSNAKLEISDRSTGTFSGLAVGTQYGTSLFGGYNNYPAIMNYNQQPLIYCDTVNDRTVFFGDTVGFGTTCAFRVNGAERVRIGSSGQIGLGGANYGTAGQFLQSQGSGSAVQWATPAFKNFGKTTISSSLSNIDIDFDHTNFNNFKLMIIGFNPSADCNMYCRFKIEGSISTINAYTSYNDKIHSGGTDENIYGNQHQNYGYISHNVGGADGTYERWSAQMTFNCAGHNMGMPFMEYHTFCKDAAGNHVMHRGIIAYQNWKTIEGIRIYPSTGTIDNGTYELYGF